MILFSSTTRIKQTSIVILVVVEYCSTERVYSTRCVCVCVCFVCAIQIVYLFHPFGCKCVKKNDKNKLLRVNTNSQPSTIC